MATNDYGDSAVSETGNGAIILTVPDKPESLTEVYSERTASSLGFSWSAAEANGGSPVLDYTNSIAVGEGSPFVDLQAGVVENTYTAVGLTAGETYFFRVQSRNKFGLSDYSN